MRRFTDLFFAPTALLAARPVSAQGPYKVHLEAIATTVALLKIEAGYHYWTDVGAGALVGASIGSLVPLLHAQGP